MSMGHQQIRPVKDVDEKDIPWSSLSDSSGGSSGSSSSFSWTDETDQSTSRDLEEQFQRFEEALYLESNPNDLPQSLRNEFKIWAEYSPHIRIRGIRAKLNKRTDNDDVEDISDVNYEEVLALHDSLESSDKNILPDSDNSNNVITTTAQTDTVNKLFDENWPIMQERIEPIVKPVSACESKTEVKMLGRFKTTNPNTTNRQKVLSRSNSSRSYLRDTSPRKANIDCGSEYSCPFSSRAVTLHNADYSNGRLSGRESTRVPRTSVRKSRINRISTFSAKVPDNTCCNRSKGIQITNKKTKTQGTDRTVILPPIETLAIKPKKPDKRVNSAMVRFTKTLPRVRPNTSKKKNISGKNFDVERKASKPPENEIDYTVRFTTLEIIGTKTRGTTNRGSRWHY